VAFATMSRSDAGGAAAAKRVAASAAPALMWAAVGTPFDVVKTRMQTADVRRPFRTPLHCVSWTVRREGARALFKGILPALLMQTPYSMVMFSVYDALKPQRGGDDGYLVGCAAAGAASGLAVTVFHQPLELWRGRVQSHRTGGGGRGSNFVNSASVLRDILRRKHLGRGSSVLLFENVLGNATYFLTNEMLRAQLAARANDGNVLGWGQEGVVGALTGVVFQLVVYPADLIKARMMTQDGLRVGQAAREMLREGGLRGFYRGCSVTLARAAVINAFGWPALKLAQRWLGTNYYP
jgi:hypothetical protein